MTTKRAGTERGNDGFARAMSGSRVSRRQRIAELEREVAELRERLQFDAPITEDEWLLIPQVFRDKMASYAYVREYGRADFALRRLRFAPKDGKESRHLQELVFEGDGVKEIVARDLGAVEANKEQILAHQVDAALHGDNDQKTRAATLLARVAGWQKTPDMVIEKKTVNLYALVGAGSGGSAGIAAEKQVAALEAAARESDPLALLSHEPGPPVRIDSDDEEIDRRFRSQPDLAPPVRMDSGDEAIEHQLTAARPEPIMKAVAELDGDRPH